MKRMTMVLALLLSVIGADVNAQEDVDSVWVDSVEVDSVALAEEFKSDYDSEEDKARMDSLIQARYAYRQALLNKSRIGMYHAMMTLPEGMDYWKYATDQTKNTNAMELATVFNNIFHLDSVNVSEQRRNNIRAIAIGMFKEGGIQHKRAPKEVELAGVYNIADDEMEQTFTFVGCFPADKPKYAVSMVVQRKHKLPASPAMVSDKVNKLVEWLNKK